MGNRRSKREGSASVARPATRVEKPSSLRQAPAPPDERVELPGGPMSLRVESLLPGKPLRVDTRATSFTLSLRSAPVELRVRGERLPLDRTHWAIAPAGHRVAFEAQSPGARLLVLSAREDLFARVAKRYGPFGLDSARFADWRSVPQSLPRTVWVDEVAQRYLFERQVCGGGDNDATRFLETEIVKESYYLLRDRDEGSERGSLVQEHSAPLQRALAHIEANLFDSASVDALARAAGASQSTLLRTFKRELGCTPSAYWRMRRLDEALVLLQRADRSIAEVASLVGYRHASAFAHAFQLRFGLPPSSVPRS